MAVFSLFGGGQRGRPWPNLKILPPTLYQFVRQHTGTAQLRLVLLSAISFPLLYLSLDLPKHIINVAVGKETAKTLFDVSFEAVPYLILVTLTYLLLALFNAVIKYAVAIYTGRLEAKANLVLRVSLSHAGRRMAGLTDASRRIPVITKETEVIGAFAGEAIVTPLFRGGTLMTIFIFLIVQEPLFGTLIVLLLSLHWTVVPFIQRHLTRRFGEYTLGIRDVADASMSDLEATPTIGSTQPIYPLLRSIFHLEYRQAQLEALLTFVADVNSHAVYFIIFLIGGIFVFDGTITIGALVAMLAASKDIRPPMLELLYFYRKFSISRVGYRLIHDNMVTGVSPDLAETAEAPIPLMARSALPG